ncbi:membrane protein insertase YidC [Planctomycetota bacterium]
MDRKGISIVVAMVLFMLLWQFHIAPKYFPPPIPEEPAPVPDAAEAPAAPAQPAAQPAPPAQPDVEPPAAPPAIVAAEPEAVQEVEDVVIENDTCEYTFTSLGGMLKKVRFKKYTEDDRETPLTLIEPFDNALLPLGIELVDSKTDLRTYNHRTSSTGSSATFTMSLPTGLTVEKKMRLTEKEYDFAVDITFSNTSQEQVDFVAKIDGPGSIVREDKGYNYLAGSVQYRKNDSPKTVATKPGKPWQIPKELPSDDVPTSDLSLVYIGVGNRFFGSALLSTDPIIVRAMGTAPLQSVLGEPENDADAPVKPDQTLTSYVVLSPIRLEPGETKRVSFTFFAGPKHTDVLAQYGSLTELLDYGIFGVVSKLMLLILRFFYAVTRNYGVAIILMTIVVKIMLFPLARKGALSQRKQQNLAPKLKELQAKHKNNKQKLNQETMKLYKEEGVSPVGGCLPMLMQFPVFIGLLRLLQYSIEIRQACFIPGWIDDLSKPDTIASLPAWIPLVQGNLNVLPLLMGAVSIIHQKMMPKPADPQAQQQMMMLKLMPLIFVFMLYNWASGLLLYWTISTTLGIVEQKILKKNSDLS